MSPVSRRSKRGFTLAEFLAVLGILAMISGFVAGIMGPMFAAPAKHQAKVDSLQTTARGLYRIQRDLRQSDAGGVFACDTSGATPVCSQPGGMTTTRAIAVVSAQSNGQANWSPANGQPQWKGFNVYWLMSNSSGSNDLREMFVADNTLGIGPSGLPNIAKAQQAVTAAMNSSNPTNATTNVLTMSIAVSPSANTVGFKYVAQSTVHGRTNRTSFESDTYARN